MESALFRLLAARAQVVEGMCRSTPTQWPTHLDRFVADLRSIDDLQPAALVVVLAEMIVDLRSYVGREVGPSTSTLIAGLHCSVLSDGSIGSLCAQFAQCVSDWFARLEPGVLVPSVQTARVAQYIDEHFTEPLVIKRLAEVSGWHGRDLGAVFRAARGISLRTYVEKTRINAAAARLRQGDKVESVAASVGWRGRSSFFRAFKRQMHMTPGVYQSAWIAGVPFSSPSANHTRRYENHQRSTPQH